MSSELLHGERQFWMEVEVYGEPVEFHWNNGMLTGNPDLVGRVERVAAGQRADLGDPVVALKCLELAVAMRPEVRFDDC